MTSTLQEAASIQEAAAQKGFEWENIHQLFAKLHEEAQELEVELKHNNLEKIKEELGDLIFVAVGIARFLHHDPEKILLLAIKKFKRRFALIEQLAKERGVDFSALSLQEKELLWIEAKKITNLHP